MSVSGLPAPKISVATSVDRELVCMNHGTLWHFYVSISVHLCKGQLETGRPRQRAVEFHPNFHLTNAWLKQKAVYICTASAVIAWHFDENTGGAPREVTDFCRNEWGSGASRREQEATVAAHAEINIEEKMSTSVVCHTWNAPKTRRWSRCGIFWGVSMRTHTRHGRKKQQHASSVEKKSVIFLLLFSIFPR